MVTKSIVSSTERMGIGSTTSDVANRLDRNIEATEYDWDARLIKCTTPYIMTSPTGVRHSIKHRSMIGSPSLYKPSERVAIWIHHLAETWYLNFNDLKQLSKQIRRLQTASPTLPSVGPLPPKQLRAACNPQGPNGTLVQLQSNKLTQTKGWLEWQKNNAEVLSELESWEHIQRPLLHTQSVKPHSSSSILRHHATVSLNKSRLLNTWSVTQPILHTMTPAYAPNHLGPSYL